MYAPSCGFRGGVVGDYPPSAAHVSPTTASSLGVEAVTDGYSLVLVASLLGFLRGGVAGLGLAAGAVPSLSPVQFKSGLEVAVVDGCAFRTVICVVVFKCPGWLMVALDPSL